MENKVKCNECNWQGLEKEMPIQIGRSGFGDDSVCPNCKTNKHIEEIEDFATHNCKYSKSISQEYPRKCIDCGKTEKL